MKSKIKNIPGFKLVNRFRNEIVNSLILIRVFLYDYKRFNRFFTIDATNKSDRASIGSWLMQDKHRIEKALSLPNPRFNFGEAVIKKLVSNIVRYSQLFDKDEVYFIAVGSLRAYKEFHLNHNVEIKNSIVIEINKLDQRDFGHEICDKVGVFKPTKPKDSKLFFKDFANSRSSCRNYNLDKKISKEEIEDIVNIAIKTPSVCNRQHWKARIYHNETMKDILKLQNGNTGFTNEIPYLAVITSDLRSFYMPSERTQPFVDGGMFAMSFIYALHSYGISSCALNWCVSPKSNEKLYNVSKIPHNESIMMLIAFGYAKDEALNAKSPRLKVDGFYTIN